MGGDIIFVKMLVNYASIIYFYKAIDTVEIFLEISTGFKFQRCDSLLSFSWLPVCQGPCLEVHRALC